MVKQLVSWPASSPVLSMACFSIDEQKARKVGGREQQKKPLNFSSSGSMYNNLPTVF
jgi:hypothetical protein